MTAKRSLSPISFNRVKRTILSTLLAIALVFRWLYPVWMITGDDGRKIDTIFSHPYWRRPAVYDAGTAIDFSMTVVHSALLVLLALLISRIPGPKPPMIVKQVDGE
jgi:hypothetical protein